MTRYLLRGVLPALAATGVVLIFLVLACGFVDLGLSIAAWMKLDTLGKVVNIVFVAFLFIFATGIVPCIVLKKLQITNLPAYLLTGSVCGMLAEYCYLFNDEFWFGWDFSAPSFAGVLGSAIQDAPELIAGMVPMLPWSVIPVVIGLLGSGLYWMRMRQRFAGDGGAESCGGTKVSDTLPTLRRGALAALVVCGITVVMLVVLAGLIDLNLFLYVASRTSGTAKSLDVIMSWAIQAYVLIALSSIVPSIALHLVRIRALGAYALAGAVSGLLAAYFWLFSFVVYENLSGWIFVPTGPTGDGYTRAPNFFHVLQHAFMSVPTLFVDDMLRLWLFTTIWCVIGAAAGSLYWLLLGRRADRTQ
jgi:hypothetical protein